METQRSICEWTAETFGTSGSTIRAAVRAQEELVELLRALTSEQYDKAPVEAADTVIVLCRVAERRRERLDWHMVPPGKKDRGRALIYATRAHMALATMIQGLGDEHRSAVSTTEIVRYVAACAAWLGADLQTEIDAKMTINRGRVWAVGADGHGYHVRTEKEAAAEPVVAVVGGETAVVRTAPNGDHITVYSDGARIKVTAVPLEDHPAGPGVQGADDRPASDTMTEERR